VSGDAGISSKVARELLKFQRLCSVAVLKFQQKRAKPTTSKLLEIQQNLGCILLKFQQVCRAQC
jgi:hypothetical protein